MRYILKIYSQNPLSVPGFFARAYILSKSTRNKKMIDIFNNTILCGKCDVKMKPINIAKNGFILRAVECPRCNSRIIHPRDEQEYKDFVELKKKQFNVKMRYVGNSYAVSIPKEIVNFMREQEKIMDAMVRLSFEEFGRISLNFGSEKEREKEKLKKERYN